MKRIFVACGSGVATSQTVASKIQSMCEDEGLDVSVEAVDIKSLESILISVTFMFQLFLTMLMNGMFQLLKVFHS